MNIGVRHTSVPLHWFGNLAAGVRFNFVTPFETAEFRYLRKRRFRRASALASLANWYTLRTGIKMRVLANAAWLRYEPLMYRLLLGRSVVPEGDALLLPRLPGHSLLSVLEENQTLNDESELGLSLAALELARLHSQWTPHPWEQQLQRFSHADATVENVLVDLENQCAHWIDFETTHEPSLPAPVRHADDLLTLLCSAAAAIETEAFPRLCEILLQGYSSTPVAGELLKLIDSWDNSPTGPAARLPGFERPAVEPSVPGSVYSGKSHKTAIRQLRFLTTAPRYPAQREDQRSSRRKTSRRYRPAPRSHREERCQLV